MALKTDTRSPRRAWRTGRPFRGERGLLFLRAGAVSIFPDQFLEHRQAPLDHAVGDAGAEAEIVRAAEVAAGDHQEVFLLGPVGEGLGVAAWGLVRVLL